MGKEKINFVGGKITIFLFLFLFLFPTVLSLSGNLSAEIDAGIVVDYRSFKQGDSTTQFLYLSDTDLSNIVDMTLEKPFDGKIIFLDSVNLTKDVIDNFVNITKNVKVSYNYMRINSSALTSLAQPALIYLYDLVYGTPEILRNGVLCPDEMCSIISYNNGDLVFRVENFSEYSAREKVIVDIPDENEDSGGGSSGGGSGGGASGSVDSSSGDDEVELDVNLDFSLDTERIVVHLKKGQLTQKKVVILNNGTGEILVALDIETFGQFISPSERFFYLSAGEEKEIELDFYFPKRLVADIYTGKIKFFSHDKEIYIDIIIVLNDNSLFDIRTTVFKNEYMNFEKVVANISLFPLGKEPIVANLTYSIIDYEKKILTTVTEEIEINKSIVLERELSLPKGTVSGNYLFTVRLDYVNAYAISSDSFTVIDRSLKSLLKHLITSEGSVILFISFLFMLFIILIVFYLKKLREQNAEQY